MILLIIRYKSSKRNKKKWNWLACILVQVRVQVLVPVPVLEVEVEIKRRRNIIIKKSIEVLYINILIFNNVVIFEFHCL